jgi:hypothetical protein
MLDSRVCFTILQAMVNTLQWCGAGAAWKCINFGFLHYSSQQRGVGIGAASSGAGVIVAITKYLQKSSHWDF